MENNLDVIMKYANTKKTKLKIRHLETGNIKVINII